MSTKSTTDTDPVKNERTGNVREVGAQAIWSLSSCKPGTMKVITQIFRLCLHFAGLLNTFHLLMKTLEIKYIFYCKIIILIL